MAEPERKQSQQEPLVGGEETRTGRQPRPDVGDPMTEASAAKR